MDILLILLAHAGEVVSKQQLIAGVWRTVWWKTSICGNCTWPRCARPSATGQAGQRYIVTVAQRGYSFVAPVVLQSIEQRPTTANLGRHNLPLRRADDRAPVGGRQPDDATAASAASPWSAPAASQPFPTWPTWSPSN